MDLIKAQRLLLKIQAFLDNGNSTELSRLEKDLLKSYILQLYDSVTTEEKIQLPDIPKHTEVPVAKIQKSEPAPVEPPQPPKVEYIKPVYTEPVTPKVQNIPIKVEVSVPEPAVLVQKPESKPVPISVLDPVIESMPEHKVSPTAEDTLDALVSLFELPMTDDLTSRFSHVPITNIESAMGLNERIFTLSELFGGDKKLFDATCADLNGLGSYAEASTLLMNGAARQFHWYDPHRIKMAEEFLRIVIRRYPKA